MESKENFPRFDIERENTDEGDTYFRLRRITNGEVILDITATEQPHCCGIAELGAFWRPFSRPDIHERELNLITDDIMFHLKDNKISLVNVTFMRDDEQSTGEYQFLMDNLINRHGFKVLEKEYRNKKYSEGHYLTTIYKFLKDNNEAN